MNQPFNEVIKGIIIENFEEEKASIIYDMPIIQYIVKKTASANKGSKTRSAFANLCYLCIT